MSYNHNAADNTFWYPRPSAASLNSNSTAEGSQTTASTLATPVDPQEDWPIRNSQDVESPLEFYNPNLDQLPNPLSAPFPMPFTSSITNPNGNTFGTEGYGAFPNMEDQRMDTRLSQDGFSPFGNAVWGNRPDNVAGGGDSFDLQHFIERYGLNSTMTRFDTPTPLAHPADNQNLSEKSGAPTAAKPSNDVGISSSNSSAQFTSGAQDAEAPRQDSSEQSGQYQANTFDEGLPPTMDASQQSDRLDTPPKVTNAGLGGPGTVRQSGPLRLLAPVPSTAISEQRMPQSQRPPKRRGTRSQSSSSQLSNPRISFESLVPNRLSPATAAFANVAPATQFMESLSSVHLLDSIACVDLLMRSELVKDYLKPHLSAKYKEGLANGARLAARSRLGMDDKINEMSRKYEDQNVQRKIVFQDKNIKNERRKRERAAGVNGSGMMTDASETGEMTPSGSKRRHQKSGPDNSSFDVDSDSFTPPRTSPKKPRLPKMTPSDLVNKFCCEVNIENRNPFFDDPIHTQLRSLSLVRLIDPAQEYTALNGEISDTNVEHWRACAGQAAGQVMDNEQTCRQCADHIGDGTVPFASCVIIDDARSAGRELQGACMNCVYLGKDRECSLRRV
ncbi:hypothetical protein SBOR_8724 [Sclerotinia borealis F-4128]|uniref:Uncharacterized protein n=1 Tax=Sclerotinia borealis (strain F-4128) TaxID=1432307 RepID=W9C5A4_SCLBF|nr:hypothetical protein SBOR_8724 [Sclerotinia borealis F-4128]